MKSTLLLAFAAALTINAAPPVYKVVGKIKIGGAGSWDYVYVDSANHRLYVSHATQTEVIDTSTDKVIATIPGTNGVHGIAIAADLGKGFTSDGSDNAVTVFDIKTNKVLGSKIKTGTGPDSIIYEPVTHRVFTFNGRSSDSTAIDAKSGDVITASIPLGGKPEFVQSDGKGHLYVNIENKSEIVEIDAKNALVSKRYSIAPCDSPSGMAISAKFILASVCDNKMAIISDPATGKVLAQPVIGARPDGVAFDDGYWFSANGGDGNISMIGETSPGKYETVATIVTTPGARTIGSDQKAHKLYLPAAEYGPTPPATDGKKAGRAPVLPDSFQIVVVGR
jgi:DNA-binding beta-propeller fold protein YncE